jgi:hypothetical protein
MASASTVRPNRLESLMLGLIKAPASDGIHTCLVFGRTIILYQRKARGKGVEPFYSIYPSVSVLYVPAGHLALSIVVYLVSVLADVSLSLLSVDLVVLAFVFISRSSLS